jgi:hypothetical protein
LEIKRVRVVFAVSAPWQSAVTNEAGQAPFRTATLAAERARNGRSYGLTPFPGLKVALLLNFKESKLAWKRVARGQPE